MAVSPTWLGSSGSPPGFFPLHTEHITYELFTIILNDPPTKKKKEQIFYEAENHKENTPVLKSLINRGRNETKFCGFPNYNVYFTALE